jgi:DNA-binding GntR family transcriptional regulator
MAEPYLSLRVADSLRAQILKGRLLPGEKLPTRQKLARKHTVHVQTVGRALQLLESQGLIWRCPGLGYYVGQRPRSR